MKTLTKRHSTALSTATQQVAVDSIWFYNPEGVKWG